MNKHACLTALNLVSAVRAQHVYFGLCLFIITACSSKIIYNHLDYVLPEYVEHYVSLDQLLEKELDRRVLTLLDWHRKTQLTQYANWLLLVQKELVDKPSKEKVKLRISELEQFITAVSDKLNDEMAELLPRLNRQQLAELFENIEDSNQEFREDYIEIDNQQRLEHYQQQLLENYENWLYTLSESQTLIIQDAAARLTGSAELRLKRRLQWQSGIKKILLADKNTETKKNHLKKFFRQFKNAKSAALEKANSNNTDIISQLTVTLCQLMTKPQQTYFIDKTNKTIKLLTELAENR
ncbi:MAG: DUF6279 family lipoprotein [Gammaproteobacteria bacterium]|nr:DUF6279 family lipoprotein [Gammaproteobacteria bacterium]